MSTLIQQYIGFLQHERRLSKHTLDAVTRDLNHLGDDVLTHTPASLAALLMARHAQGASPATLARLASSFRGFFAHLQAHYGQLSNPAADLKTPKLAKSLPKALKAEQVDALIQSEVDFNAYKWQRTRFLIELLYGTGLRISEALSLTIQQEGGVASHTAWICPSRKLLQVEGKGGKTRQVPLVNGLQIALVSYLDQRCLHVQSLRTGSCSNLLFLNGKGGALHVRQAQLDISAYARLANVDRHVHPHMLRHTFGSHVLQESQDLRAVQELLGHASVQSTQIYTALDFKHLTKVYDEAFPRSKSSGSS